MPERAAWRPWGPSAGLWLSAPVRSGQSPVALTPSRQTCSIRRSPRPRSPSPVPTRVALSLRSPRALTQTCTTRGAARSPPPRRPCSRCVASTSPIRFPRPVWRWRRATASRAAWYSPSRRPPPGPRRPTYRALRSSTSPRGRWPASTRATRPIRPRPRSSTAQTSPPPCRREVTRGRCSPPSGSIPTVTGVRAPSSMTLTR